MIALKRAAALLFVLLALCSAASASGGARDGADGLYPYLSGDGAEGARAGRTDTGYDLNAGLNKIIEKAFGSFGRILKAGLSSAAKLLALSLLCAAVSVIGAESQVGAYSLNAAAAMAVVIVGVSELDGIIRETAQLQNELNIFSKALLPTLAAAGTAAGSPAASVAKQGAALLFSDLLITLFSKVFLPLVYVFIGVKTIGIVNQNQFFGKLAQSIKNLSSLAVRTILTMYFAYISVMGLVGAAADSMARRAAKTAVSAGIPVVGGVLTEAADSIFAGAALVKNAIGIFGILGILGGAVLPLLSAGTSYLLLRAGAAVSSAVSESGGQQAMDTLADAMSMIFALCAASVALLLITVIIFMQSYVP